jgi:competence protein ComEC
MLLTGDAEDEQQRSLIGAVGPAVLHAEILKVAHHGSAFQDPEFLGAVAPAVALVSVGAGNDYGHPSPVVLARLGRDGARVLRTDQAGDLAMVDDSGRLKAVTHGLQPGRRRRRRQERP